MAPTKFGKQKAEDAAASGQSFEDIVRTSRQRKQNEEFAQLIFGKGRRFSAPGALNKRSKTTDAVPSLASRVGIQKRATKSSTNLKRENQAKSRALASRPSALKNELRENDNGSLDARIGNNGHSSRSFTQQQQTQQNISIRGIAGPVTVMAQNFASGTTAADIRSAFEPVGGEMLSCRLKASNPTVIAEMIFADRSGADAVIETFNNQRADGRLLYVYLQAGGGAQALPAPSQGRSSQYHDQTSLPRTDARGWESNDRTQNRAEPEYQDGRYGFDNPEEDMEVELDQPSAASSGRYNGGSQHDDRDGYRLHQNSGYRDDRRRNDRYDRGPRQERGLYSDRYSRGQGQGQGQGWR